MAHPERWPEEFMHVASQKQLIEGLGAGVFVRRRNAEARLQEKDFHLAFTESVMVWFTPGEYREEKIEEALRVAKRFHSVRSFRFPSVHLPASTVARIRAEFPRATIEGVK